MKALFFLVTLVLSTNLLYADNATTECPSGFTDTGSHCLKPPSYGRGFGFPSQRSCEGEYSPQRCEKCLSLFYPRCKPSYHTVGCNVCEPNCPSNMTDIGLSCQK